MLRVKRSPFGSQVLCTAPPCSELIKRELGNCQLVLIKLLALLQERFHGIVPILSKWSGAIVGLTLIGIGVLGVYESLVLNEEPLPVESVAMAGATNKGSRWCCLDVK